MQTRLIELQAHIDMNKELLLDERNRLQAKVKDMLQDRLTDPCSAMVVRTRVRHSVSPIVDIGADIGFWNSAEGRVDFGSDITLYYSSEEGQLQVNYGTIGHYTKNDIYQVKRVKLLEYLFRHIDTIESKFNELVIEANSGVYRTIEDQTYRLQQEVNKIKNEQKQAEINQIEASLKIGDAIRYKEGVYRDYMLFNTSYEKWVIHSISEKKIKVKGVDSEFVRMLDKQQVLNQIRNQTLIVGD